LTFRLRTLLVLVAGICAVLAWRVHQVRSRELALQALRSARAWVEYGDEAPGPLFFSMGMMPDIVSGRCIKCWHGLESPSDESNLEWSGRLRVFVFGAPNHVYGIAMSGHDDDETVSGAEVAEVEDAVQRLPSLAELKFLNLDGSQARESALQNVGRLRNLERLYLLRTHASDQTLKQIGKLTKLEYLAIGSPHVTARGLANLRDLRNLVWLELNECTFDDDGVEELRHLKGLRALALPATVSDEAVRRLRKLLPQCNILRGERVMSIG
jgi:hypothetical protein